ncbi:MAG: der [Chlamydiales bacterium]|jgi:GTP-binding protein|nr:der [Chlamydiales bacterium]
MSTLPKIALVGRPNVGKSALFNRIAKRRIAIIDEMPGVTRDRLYAKSELFGCPFEIIDTGGLDESLRNTAFYAEILQSTKQAIEEADSIVLVVDSQTGITQVDEQLAKILLKEHKKLTLAINKIDDPSQHSRIYDFTRLGIKDMVGISAIQDYQIAELLEKALSEVIPTEKGAAEEKEPIKVAIVGRANVGKSSLLNHLLNEERSIVSPIEGTTRDSINAQIDFEGTPFTLIDTAGIRRKHAEKQVVDKFASIRTFKAIENADICLLVVDARQGLTTQELKIAHHIEQMGKGCIVLLNKWDLVKGFRMEHCLKTIDEEVSFLKHCPKLCISAKFGRNLEKIFPLVSLVYEKATCRITTHQLNKAVEKAMQKNHPPMLLGKRLRIYYTTQVGVLPPRFVFFVNRAEYMSDTYKKYLQNQFRLHFDFSGTPLLFFLKSKPKKEQQELNKHSSEKVGSEQAEEEEEEAFDEAEFTSED